MKTLALEADELRLLRLTGDLVFVEESPLWPFEAEPRDPSHTASLYAQLIERGVVDAERFRLADETLNRLAPITECDARIDHLVVGPRGERRRRVFYLLEEIGVRYATAGERHLFGPDLDPQQLVAEVARRMTPRRARGDLLDTTFGAGELVLFASLTHALASRLEVGIGLDELEGRVAQMTVGGGPTLSARRADDGKTRVRRLLAKGVLRQDDLGIVTLRPALVDFARALRGRARHIVARTDFAPGGWVVRETTFLPSNGTLFALSTTGDGAMRLEELDARRLTRTLRRALAPVTPLTDDVTRTFAPLGRRSGQAVSGPQAP